jgi:L-alanine-DL-glutamate epimerase-like enolase superfamily enzyme
MLRMRFRAQTLDMRRERAIASISVKPHAKAPTRNECGICNAGVMIAHSSTVYCQAGDLKALRTVRAHIAEDVAIMVDYNQALTYAEAVTRGHELENEGIYWLEEPIPHSDYETSAALARELKVPLQIGENFNGPEDLLQAVSVRASDFIMPAVARIGGVTGWMHAAGIAAAKGIEMSSHLMPEVSAHLLCVTRTAHWLEHVDWADAILQHPLKITDGKVMTSGHPGSGLGMRRSLRGCRRFESSSIRSEDFKIVQRSLQG